MGVPTCRVQPERLRMSAAGSPAQQLRTHSLAPGEGQSQQKCQLLAWSRVPLPGGGTEPALCCMSTCGPQSPGVSPRAGRPGRGLAWGGRTPKPRLWAAGDPSVSRRSAPRPAHIRPLGGQADGQQDRRRGRRSRTGLCGHERTSAGNAPSTKQTGLLGPCPRPAGVSRGSPGLQVRTSLP